MKNFKKIGIIIICIFIVIVIILVALSFMRKKENDEIAEQYNERTEIYEYNVTDLKDLPEFLTIESYIQTDKDEKFVAEKIKYIEKDDNLIYVVSGTSNNEEKFFKFVVDTENDTYSIEEVKNIKNIDDIDISKIDEVNIGNSGKNEYVVMEMTDEDCARKYLEMLVKLEVEEPEKAYEMLDPSYRKERFPELQDYLEYVNECKDVIEEGVLAKYSVEYEDDYVMYIIVDTNSNSYKIKATAVKEFTVILDNYTIKEKGFDLSYSQSDDIEKVKINVYRFLEMINNKDYKHAYELLDENFRKNNFGTIEEFKKFARENFFYHNIDTYEGDIKNEGNNYICDTIIMSDSSSAAQKKKITVVMKLKEGTDFVMSFSLEDINE